MSEHGQTATEWLDQLDASHQPERDGRCVVDVEPMPCDVRKLITAIRGVLALADEWDRTPPPSPSGVAAIGTHAAAALLRAAVSAPATVEGDGA